MTLPLNKCINEEIAQAAKLSAKGELDRAFNHLERAHVLGQSQTFVHTRVHWRMLKIGWKRRDGREILGQIVRIAGASTKTAFGIYPSGNTGGTNVSPFKPMPIGSDLQLILETAKQDK